MLYIAIVIISLVFGLSTASNRIVGFLSLMGLGWLIATDYPTTNLDYHAYVDAYNVVSSGITPFEKGYTSLELLGYNYGLEYVTFRAYFTVATMLLLYIAVVRFTNNVSLFVALFASTTFFLEGTQIRNLLMISIVIFATSFLKKMSLWRIIIFIILVYWSGQIHSSGYMFYVVLPIRCIPYEIFKKYGIIFLGLIGLFSVFLKIFGVNILYMIILKLFGGIVQRANFLTKLQGYTVGSNSTIVILIWTTAIISVCLAYMLCNNIKLLENKNTAETSVALFSGVSASLLVIPFIVMAPDYSRISRNAVLFLFILIAYFYQIKHQQFKNMQYKRKGIGIVIILFLCLFTFTHDTLWGEKFISSIPYTMKLQIP